MQRTKEKPRSRRFLKAALAFIALVILIQMAVFFAEVALLSTRNPPTTAFIQRYLNQCLLAGEDCPFSQEWKPLDEISIQLQEAVLIGEDDAFFEHEGIDTEALREAAEVNRRKKKIVRGGSTITQQLAKNLYLSPSKNYYRKGKEMIISLLMEKILTKQRILEIYLNVIQWGRGIYGAEAASLHYFNKPASKLTMDEAAFLAAIIPNPERLTDSSHSKVADRRKAIILRRMQSRNHPELRAAENPGP